MVVLSALIGLCISACVFVPLRLRSERESDRRISDLEDRIMQLEMAVAQARRNLQPVPTYPQDSGHLHNLRTFKTLDGLNVKCVECGYVERLENPWPTS